jgi:5'-nucleotidase
VPVNGKMPDFALLKPWVVRTLETLLRLEPPFLVNVNLPQRPKGFLWTRQSVRAYEGLVVPGEDPMGRPLFWFAAKPLKEAEEGTDRWAVEQGFIAATPLRLDLTDEGRLQPELAHD